MTEKEKMLAGEIYSAVDPQLIEELTEVKEIIHDYNLLRPSEKEKAREILKGLLGHIADDEILIIQPFYCDYGKQISVGKRFFANFNFTVLDEARVTIGDNVWIGGSVTILPGVTIGDNVTIAIENKQEHKHEDKHHHYLRREFSYSNYEQSYTLPDDVVKDQISAKVEDGILTVTMPKTEPKQKVTKAIEVS